MLEWNEIKGVNNNLNYYGNQQNGVILPAEKEEVLFCCPCFDESKDIYFSGYIIEGKHSLKLIDSTTGGSINNLDGIRWARFNKPKTENNVGYAIAYLDEYGKGYTDNIPYILDVLKNEIGEKMIELKSKGYSQITVFDYVKPCNYMYDWDYINKNKIN